ncbi:MAG: DUF2785 domain-containing protein [Burkholderiales bacterium]|nr:DUF2785 domain-containing protein [Burkholderiales bacterium]
MGLVNVIRQAGLGALLLCVALSAAASCPPAGMDKPALEALKKTKWIVGDDARRQALALELLDCLASPDPQLRDELAFEALAHWLRAKAITPATLHAMRTTLVPQLRPAAADAAGFRQPFAALALAEVARVDRLQPVFSAPERAELVEAATGYVAGVRDYRGFDPKDGWRHGVAHGADLLLQLSLNPALDAGQLKAILAAVAAQAMPPGEQSYVYGEGDRLMTPVFYIGRRNVFGTDEWSAWFAALAASRPKADPATRASLAARHNLSQFLLPLYASLKESGTPEMQARMLPGVTAALKTLD